MFKKKTGGLMDEIRCDEKDFLVWKWHPKDAMPGNNSRENAIRWGSSLRVKDGEVAVFVYKQKYEVMQDFIVGPYDQIIQTKNLPVLASIIGMAYDSGTPFQAEVYFINLAKVIQVKFGVPFFDVFDPRFEDFGVPVAVRGTITFKIDSYRDFVELHRLNTFTLNDFEEQIRSAVSRYVKDVVSNAPAVNNIPLVQIETKISEINDVIELNIKERLKEEFGVVVSSVDVSAIELDKTSEAYKQLMFVTKEKTTATINAETSAKIKDIEDKQRIEAEHYAETLKIQREEGQYAQRKQTQMSNFAAYQVESQTEVGVAGANALGQMGSNDIDMSSGSGINMAAMMASMAIGGTVGQNIAGTMNNVMSGINQPINKEIVPPPVPNVMYHIAINGKSYGPYEIEMISQKIRNGEINKDTLVWTSGMENWIKAEEVDEIKEFFDVTPPPIPNN